MNSKFQCEKMILEFETFRYSQRFGWILAHLRHLTSVWDGLLGRSIPQSARFDFVNVNPQRSVAECNHHFFVGLSVKKRDAHDCRKNQMFQNK